MSCILSCFFFVSRALVLVTSIAWCATCYVCTRVFAESFVCVCACAHPCTISSAHWSRPSTCNVCARFFAESFVCVCACVHHLLCTHRSRPSTRLQQHSGKRGRKGRGGGGRPTRCFHGCYCHTKGKCTGTRDCTPTMPSVYSLTCVLLLLQYSWEQSWTCATLLVRRAQTLHFVCIDHMTGWPEPYK